MINPNQGWYLFDERESAAEPSAGLDEGHGSNSPSVNLCGRQRR